MLPTKSLVILAVAEGAVFFSAVIRMVLPGLGVDFARPPQLAWFVITLLVAASALSQFIIRALRLQPRIRAGEQVEDEQRQIFAFSLALIGMAGLLSLAGPQAFERLFG